MSMMFSLFGDV